MDNDRAFADILNECLEALAAGEASIEECMARYPQHAPNLEELLRLGDVAKRVSLPTPTPEMLVSGEQRFVQAARAKASQAHGAEKNTSLIDALKAKLRTWPGWVLPATALSASMAVLFVCAVLALIGGSLLWNRLRGAGTAPAVPPVVVSEDDHLTPAPSEMAEKEVAQSTSPLPSPTRAEGVAQNISPLPVPTANPEGDEYPPAHTVFIPLVGKPLPPHLAMLQALQGVVEVQGADGAWSAASDGQTLEAGTRMRTGALSRVHITFYDGSTACLEPNTEVSIDALGQNPEDQSRIVEMTQWVGETDHDVAPSYGAKGRYQVHTPSGTGVAKGTFFHVSVTPALIVRFGVDEGAVQVTNVNVTVLVVAGQLTTVRVDSPPSKPAFRITGEGEVQETGSTWRIAGKSFGTHEATVIVGNPQVGDWVHVDGHLTGNARVADRIVLLRRAPANRFRIMGEVEATETISWTVAGQMIAVDEATEIGVGIQVGDMVRVDGVVEGPEGETLLAETIMLLDERGVPFSFVGVVEETAEAYWMISGISITVNAETVIDGDIAVGDIVRVRGVFLEEEGGVWLAHSIAPIVPERPIFAFTGEVEATEMVTWTVSGLEIVVNDETEIDQGIQIGNRVRVQGIIEASGALLAESIHLVELPALSFVFVGAVTEITEEYWVISGISVTVNAETVIEDGLVLGDMVRVRGRMMTDGSWLARSISRLVPEEHRFEFVGIVDRIDPWVVSGIAIETRMWTEIKDEIEVGDRVKVEGQILPDGTWLAEEIRLADGGKDPSFEFIGVVESIEPWVVSGISLTVNYQTEIVDEIKVGDQVKVEGRILPGGEWLATEIKLAEDALSQGCLQIAALVLRADAKLIVLQDGSTLPLAPETVIDGDLQANSVILFHLCFDGEGNVTIVSIVVIDQLEPVIIVQPTTPPTQPTPPAAQPTIPPTRPPSPPGGGGSIVVNDNNRTQTFTCNGHSVTINGNDNTITLLGSCGPVTVRGNNNWVSIRSATLVANTGNNNTIVGP